MTTTTTPAVVARYLDTSDRADNDALVKCFTEGATVADEGETFRGRDEIRQWRETVAGRWTYTTKVTGTEMIDDAEYRVFIRIEGDFPGGVADLIFRFGLNGDLISTLHIGG